MMQAYFASLLREKSASKIVIVKDNAATSCRKEDFTDRDDLSSEGDDDWQRPSSFKNTSEVNSAPSIPARKESNDSLCLLSSVTEEESHKPRGLFNKFRDLRPTFNNTRHSRQNQAGSYPSPSTRKTCDTSGEDHGALETKDDISLSSSKRAAKKKVEKQRNSWDGTELSPMASLNDIWNDDRSPSLPLRKKSDDNLIDQATPETAASTPSPCFPRRRSSLDTAPVFPSLKITKGHPQRRGSLNNSILMADEQTKRHFQRRGSVDNTPLSSSNRIQLKKALQPPRRGSLDNSILMADEHTKRHFQRRGSLDNTILPPKIDSKYAFTLSEDNPAVPISRPNRGFQRRSSMDNAMVSSNNQAQLRAERRSSMDNTGMQQKPPRTPYQRRSSLSTCVPSNAVVSSNNQAQLRSRRRSSMDNAGVQHYVDHKPPTPYPRRSSLSTYMPSTNEREFQHSACYPPDPPGKDGNHASPRMEASAVAATSLPLPPPQRQNSFKHRILSKLNSPKWSSKMPFSSDLFKVSTTSTKNQEEDDDDSDDCSVIEPAPACRQVSEDQMSLLSDDTLAD